MGCISALDCFRRRPRLHGLAFPTRSRYDTGLLALYAASRYRFFGAMRSRFSGPLGTPCNTASCLSALVIVERFSEFGAGRSSDKDGDWRWPGVLIRAMGFSLRFLRLPD